MLLGYFIIMWPERKEESQKPKMFAIGSLGGKLHINLPVNNASENSIQVSPTSHHKLAFLVSILMKIIIDTFPIFYF